MKYIASFVLTCLLGLTCYALVQSYNREQIHQRILDLRAELNKEEEQFLAPSPSDLQAYGEFLKQPDSGLIRLLPREKYDNPKEMTIRGGGAYYSFTQLKHEYG